MDDKGGFDEDLKRALRELNETAGECPSADVLETFARGGLPTGERTAVQKHLAGCGMCELVVGRLQTLETSDWKATEKRIKRSLGIAGDAMPAWRRILWNPLPAYALAAAMAISLGVAPRVPGPKATPQAVIGVPTVLSFEPETRGGFHVSRLAGQGNSDTVLFKLFIPIHEKGTYWATILNS